MIRKMITAALLPLAFVAAAAPQDAPRSIRVTAVGLDLRTDAGQRHFQRRIDHAVEMVCDAQGSFELARRARAAQCRRDARVQARRDMAAVVAAANGQDRLAAVTVAARGQ